VPRAPGAVITENGASAAITTGVVRLGVRREGTLGAGITDPGSPPGTISQFIGIRHAPTNVEGTYYYESWGLADAAAPAFSDDLRAGATVEQFVSDDDRTVTHAVLGRRSDAGKQLRVTHAYAPSAETPNLFSVRVTIENAGDVAVGELRYARAFIWRITPRQGIVTVTAQGTAASRYVLGASNDFLSDPLGPLTRGGEGRVTGDFVDVPPPSNSDNATSLMLRLGALRPGERVEFTTFLGAAGTEAEALGALATVGADVHVLAQADAGAPDPGSPATFMYGFSSASVRGPVDRRGTPLADRNSGRCLDVLGESRAAGTPLIVYDCHGRANQRFTYPAVGRTGEVRVYADGDAPLCLDAESGGTADGTRIIAWPCHGGSNQQWTRTAEGELRGVGSGKCVDVLGARTENLTDVWLWSCFGGANQRWDPAATAM
jgi:hypothetical protein